jgi:YesN/AraC family two-component response regulator
MIRALIIDDDAYVREQVASIIESHCPNVSIAAKADNVKSGVAAINEYDPDLILLDIKMPDGSGFDLIRHFDKPESGDVIMTDGSVVPAASLKKDMLLDLFENLG